MKLNSFANLEGISQCILRDRPALGDIADNLGVILRIESQQRAVVRRDRMEHGKRGFTVTIVGRRGAAHGEYELAPGSGILCLCSENIGSKKNKRHARCNDYFRSYPNQKLHWHSFRS